MSRAASTALSPSGSAAKPLADATGYESDTISPSELATVLNIALLIVGTAATLAAFEGKTWDEDDEKKFVRVNARGWVSLSCLALALVLGVWKQIVETSEKDVVEIRHLKEIADANQANKKLQEDLRNAKTQLDGLKALNEAENNRLEDARTTLSDVRGNLIQTRDDLSQQSGANLIATLAERQQTIAAIEIVIPFTAHANAGNTIAEILTPKRMSSCVDSIDVGWTVYSADQNRFKFDFEMEDSKTSSTTNDIPNSAVFSVSHRLFAPDDDNNLGTDDTYWSELLGQNSTNYRTLIFEIIPAVKTLSAAEFINNIRANTKDAPLLFLAADRLETISLQCMHELQVYFNAAMQKVYFGVRLRDEHNLRIYFRLASTPIEPIREQGTIRIGFTVDSRPLIYTRSDFDSFAKTPDGS